MNETQAPPNRTEVEFRWRSLVEHRATRHELHIWASKWMERCDVELDDPMVLNALQHLHGFDLTYNDDNKKIVWHGSGEFHLYDDEDIKNALDRWRSNCMLYDADPRSYLENAKRQAIEAVRDIRAS